MTVWTRKNSEKLAELRRKLDALREENAPLVKRALILRQIEILQGSLQ